MSGQAAVVDRISLGGGFASLLEKRGVIYYKDFQIAPVVAAYFFDRRIEYLTDSIGYRQFLIEDRLRWRSSVHYINDDPLFPKHKNFMHRTVDRAGTFEWMNRLELYLPSYSKYQGELDVGIAKDLKEHSGVYLEISGKIKIFEKIGILFLTIVPKLIYSRRWDMPLKNIISICMESEPKKDLLIYLREFGLTFLIEQIVILR